MARKKTGLAALTVLVLAVTAMGLEGKNGYTATQLFVADDVRSSVVYDSSFEGTAWADLASFGLGGDEASGDAVGLDGEGNLYFLVYGSNGTGTEYTGLIQYDGTAFVHLVQEAWDYTLPEGARIQTMAMSPVTSGLLTAGHPVYLCHSTSVWGAELVGVDPTTSPPTTTTLYVWEAPADGGVIPYRFTIAADGAIYAIHPEDDTIRRLTYDAGGGEYVESTIDTDFAAGSSLRVGPDGDLYTFSASQAWYSSTKQPKTIYRVDPSTGSWSEYAEVPGWTFVFDWAWDSEGNLWIGLRDSRKGIHYVTGVVPGGTTSVRSAISDSSYDPQSVAAGPEGRVHVLERVPVNGVDRPYDTIHELSPGSGDGDGGGGKDKKK